MGCQSPSTSQGSRVTVDGLQTNRIGKIRRPIFYLTGRRLRNRRKEWAEIGAGIRVLSAKFP